MTLSEITTQPIFFTTEEELYSIINVETNDLELNLLDHIFQEFIFSGRADRWLLLLELKKMIQKEFIILEQMDINHLKDTVKIDSEHEKLKMIGSNLLVKMGGSPRTEENISYGRADVYCEKMNIAIECGFTPIERLFNGIWNLDEFWVIPYTRGWIIYKFKRGKNFEELSIQRNRIVKEGFHKVNKKVMDIISSLYNR